MEIEKLSKEQTKPLPTDKATWDLVVRNPGLTALTNVVVVDNLPQPFTYLTSTSTDPQWSFTSAAAVGSGPGGTQPVTWTISRLEPGESVTIALSVNVPPTGIPDYQWYQNEVGASATEVADMVVNTSKIRFFQRRRSGIGCGLIPMLMASKTPARSACRV